MRKFTSQFLSSYRLLFKKQSLLNPTFLQIHEEEQEQEARNRQRKQEVKRTVRIMRRYRVDNGARDKWSNERRCLADNAEQAEEEELVAAWCYWSGVSRCRPHGHGT